MDGKVRRESMTTMTELVLPNDANLIGNLLGGRLMHWIDIAGALAAGRHSDGIVATMTMDMVEFKRPVKVGDIVTLRSYVTWTGRTSIEVAVEVFSEDTLTGVRQFINKVYLVFVGVDKDGKKRPVPGLIPETEEEKRECGQAMRRRERRLLIAKETEL